MRYDDDDDDDDDISIAMMRSIATTFCKREIDLRLEWRMPRQQWLNNSIVVLLETMGWVGGEGIRKGWGGKSGREGKEWKSEVGDFTRFYFIQ